MLLDGPSTNRPVLLPAGSRAAVLPRAVLMAGLTVGESDRPEVNLTVWGPTVTLRCCNTSVAALGVGIPDAIAPY